MSRPINPINRLFPIAPVIAACAANTDAVAGIQELVHTGKRGRPATQVKGKKILAVLTKFNAKEALAAFEETMKKQDAATPTDTPADAPKKRGRPAGSKNKKPAKRGRPAGKKTVKKQAKRTGLMLPMDKVVAACAIEPNIVDGLKGLLHTGKRGRPATTIAVTKVRKFLTKNNAPVAIKALEDLVNAG